MTLNYQKPASVSSEFQAISRSYEDLDGAQGREVFFRPTRYRSQDLDPIPLHVSFRHGEDRLACVMLDVSQSGIAFEWSRHAAVALDQVLEDFVVHAGEFEAYRGQVRVSSVRDACGVTCVAVSFVDFLMNIDDLLTLRDVRRWGRDGSTTLQVQHHSWFTPGDDAFKARVADFQLFLEDSRQALALLEASVPWTVVHGEPSTAHTALVRRIHDDFVPDVLKFSADIDAALRQTDPEQSAALRVWSQRKLLNFLMESPWMQRAYNKPLGYPGDYEVMKYVYERPFEGRSLFARAVSYAFLQTPAAWAVRARKDMQRDQLLALARAWDRPNVPIRILSVAAGPAQEIYEFLSVLEEAPAPIEIVLFDQDNGALAYAYGRLRRLVDARWSDRVKVIFLHDSIKRLLKDPAIFTTFGRFEVVLCAGLFDYLKIPTAVTLTHNLAERLQPGGTAYIGNMEPRNSSRWFMEQHLDWHLIHRTRQEMLAFAHEGVRDADIGIIEEASGVNPFLMIKARR